MMSISKLLPEFPLPVTTQQTCVAKHTSLVLTTAVSETPAQATRVANKSASIEQEQFTTILHIANEVPMRMPLCTEIPLA